MVGSMDLFPQSCYPGSSRALIASLPGEPPLYVSRRAARWPGGLKDLSLMQILAGVRVVDTDLI